MQVPNEVLITSMKDHQRFFYVTDKDGNLLPNFVSVRNGNKDYLENVVAGNEKVLTARLEDAKFFYEEDQQHTIADYVERLKKVMFHDKIGTIYEKMERVNLLAKFLGNKLGLSETELKDLDRASMIYKFDLVTGMVGEFSELQGIMGEIYARLQGEDDNVSTAIREEYMPTSSEGELPQSNVGAVLSIADKLDSIQSFFAANMIPSGSNDPYALRRQDLGIIRIALDKGWDISLPLLHEAINYAYAEREDLYKNTQPITNVSETDSFVIDRLAQVLSGNKFRRDILDAVVARADMPFIQALQAAQVLSKHAEDDNFKEVIEALTRVTRLAKKAPEFGSDAVIDSTLFENDTEKVLADEFAKVKAGYGDAEMNEKFAILSSLKDSITAYFDATMIMADDEKVKNNRLLQLVKIAELTEDFGSLDKLIVK